RRPAPSITPGRSARLHRLVALLARGPRTRDELRAGLGVGLRTFYRELALLRRCGVGVRRTDKTYSLRIDAAEAEGRLPFPDPRLSFAEMAELALGPSEAARRLAALLDWVTGPAGSDDRSPNDPGRRRGKLPTITSSTFSSAPSRRDGGR